MTTSREQGLPATHPGLPHWVALGLWGLAFLAVLGSAYIRHVSAQPKPLHDCAAFVVGLLDSRENQGFTATCVGVYSVFLTVCHCLLRDRIAEEPGGSTGGISAVRWPWPEVFLGLAVGWGAVQYAFTYQSAYPRMDFLTFLAGASGGQAVAVLRLRRAGAGRLGSLHQEALPPLVFAVALAAVLHPDMGEAYQYRGHVRWTGLCFDPNTFGLLMAAGIVLTMGILVQGPSSVECAVRNADQRSPKWTPSLKWGFLLAAGAAIGLGLVKSYSRGAWVAAALGLAYLGWQGGKTEKLKTEMLKVGRYWVALAVICASVGAIGFWSFRHSEGGVVRRAYSVANANDFSWHRRLAAYEGALQMLAERPWFGFGWNQPEPVYGALYCQAKVDEGMAIRLNDYFMLGMTLGIPALACFGVYLCLALRPRLPIANRKWQMGEREWLKAVCRAGTVVLAVGFCFDGGLFRLATGATFWILLELGRKA